MKHIGIFTSGGDCSGMNAAIRAVVRTALHYDVKVSGIYRGYEGMIHNEIKALKTEDVSRILHLGGTILKTARSKDFTTKEGRQKAFDNLKKHGIEGLVAIGGNGTYKGAEVFYDEHQIPTVGLPGTIDNDLYGSDYTIGFDTAVEVAMDAIDKVRDTADAHNRVFFVELMGRDSGFIALNAGLATGAESILLPEIIDDFEQLIFHFEQKKRAKSYSIILVAEGDKEGNAISIMEKFKEKFPNYDCRATILGHIQRGGRPSANDRILATRLGAAAVEALMRGKFNTTLGIINGKIHETSFEEAIGKRKTINKSLWELNKMLSE